VVGTLSPPSLSFSLSLSPSLREEFADHGLSELVTLTCRDVCKEGFGLESIADAGMEIIFPSTQQYSHSVLNLAF